MTIEAPDAAPEEASLNVDQLLGQTEGRIESDQAIFIDYLTADHPRSGGDDMPKDANEDVALPVKFISEALRV